MLTITVGTCHQLGRLGHCDKVTFTAILAVEARVIARVTALDSGLTVAA